jgi:hypothetical protein
MQHDDPQFRGHVVDCSGVDIRRTVSSYYITKGRIAVPKDWVVLPDLRVSSEVAGEQARQGLPPTRSSLGSFDPRQGPFTLPAALDEPWAQSLDFLRDIKGLRLGEIDLTKAWIATWLQTPIETQQKQALFFSRSPTSSTKTDRLIWRAKRVLNCLCYALPVVEDLNHHQQGLFWQHLIFDITKLAAPTDTLWTSLTNGFDPLSPRALWLRALALVSIECSARGFLTRDIISTAIDHLTSAIEKDGTMKGGSIMATLSAALDLSMVLALPELKVVQERVCQALRTLRFAHGNLVLFDGAKGNFKPLLDKLLTQTSQHRSPVLSVANIAQGSRFETGVWLQAPVTGKDIVGVCEVEIDTISVLSNSGSARTGIGLVGPIEKVTNRVKRRDESDICIIQSESTFQIQGATYQFSRDMRLSDDGNKLSGNDFIATSDPANTWPLTQIWFAVPHTCRIHVAKDAGSALIIMPNRRAWRLRYETAKVKAVLVREGPKSATNEPATKIIEFNLNKDWHKMNFSFNWSFFAEDAL